MLEYEALSLHVRAQLKLQYLCFSNSELELFPEDPKVRMCCAD